MDLHILKVKGCISFIVNVVIHPICEQDGCLTDLHRKEISISCTGSVCVDYVLKCSIKRLPVFI